MPSGSAMSPGRVDDQLSIHGVGDLTLEGAQCFLRGLALGHLAIEVLSSFALVANLGDGDHMDGVVEASVARGLRRCRTLGPLEASMGAVALYEA